MIDHDKFQTPVFIGDSPRDKIAAENADCDFLWIHELTSQ